MSANDSYAQHYKALAPQAAAKAVPKHTEASEANGSSVQSSLFATIVNVTKGIIGSGMLTLPLAIHESSVLPGFLLLALSSFVSAFSFTMLGYGCAATGAESFHELWTATMGQSTAWAVQSAIMLDNSFTLWAYSTLVADFVGKALIDLLPGIALAHSRYVILGLIGSLIFAPLSYQQTLDALKYTSGLGLCAIGYSCVCVFSEYVASGEGVTHLQPNFCAVNFLALKSSVLFAFSFGCHYSVPKVYAELAQKSERRIGLVALGAFTCSLLIYTGFALFGYARFGKAVAGNVLVNFEQGNKAVLFMWIAMAASVISSYPMIFIAFKENFYGMIGVPEKAASRKLRLGLVVCGVSISCFLGAAVEDASLVMGICGALVSSAVQFCFPALIFLNLPPGSRKDHKQSPRLRLCCQALRIFGVFTAVTGLAATIYDALGGAHAPPHDA